MLWEEGQKRVARQERARLSELFVAVSDAVVAAMGRTGLLERSPKLPGYVEPVPEKGKSLADLLRDFPGHVASGVTEFRDRN